MIIGCKHCGQAIREVPVGDGTAWVSGIGYRACLADARNPRQHEPE